MAAVDDLLTALRDCEVAVNDALDTCLAAVAAEKTPDNTAEAEVAINAEGFVKAIRQGADTLKQYCDERGAVATE